jgi:hypothetical protein
MMGARSCNSCAGIVWHVIDGSAGGCLYRMSVLVIQACLHLWCTISQLCLCSKHMRVGVVNGHVCMWHEV